MKYVYKVIDRGTGSIIKKGKVSGKNEEYARAKAIEKEGLTHAWDIMVEEA